MKKIKCHQEKEYNRMAVTDVENEADERQLEMRASS